MKRILILIITAMTILTACGEDKTSNHSKNANNPKNSSPVKVTESKLSRYMLEDTVCNALSVDNIKKTFNVVTEITFEGSTNRYTSGVTCNYSWTRADAKEREEKFMTYIIDQMQGKVEKISMRKRTTKSNISIKIEQFKGNADRFIPAKLTEEQLQKQIENAKKRANDRLSDEQKKVAGGMANNMMEKMLRQNNQNETIEGIGDGAYWSPVAGGGLSVLSGNTKMFISLMIGDTQEQDIDNAKKIAQLILK